MTSALAQTSEGIDALAASALKGCLHGYGCPCRHRQYVELNTHAYCRPPEALVIGLPLTLPSTLSCITRVHDTTVFATMHDSSAHWYCHPAEVHTTSDTT